MENGLRQSLLDALGGSSHEECGGESRAKMSSEKLEAVFEGSHSALNKRLCFLKHNYHNEKHIDTTLHFLKTFLLNINLKSGILSEDDNQLEREKTLLLEAMYRHDDDHAGHTHRQDVKYEEDYERLSRDDILIYRFVREVCGNYFGNYIYKGNISNEERAGYWAVKELFGKIPIDDLIFIVEHILGTSFAQDNEDKLGKERKQCYRPYDSETPTQQLLALADISSSIFLGWNVFFANNMNIWKESHDPIPENFEEWKENADGFLEFYAKPLLKKLEPFFEGEYLHSLLIKLDAVKLRLDRLSEIEKQSIVDQLNKITPKN